MSWRREKADGIILITDAWLTDPHVYNNYEGFDFPVDGTYYEFPILESGQFTCRMFIFSSSLSFSLPALGFLVRASGLVRVLITWYRIPWCGPGDLHGRL